MTKKIFVCSTLYFRHHISYDLHLWYTCMYKRIMSPGIFYIFFFKILILRIIRVEVGGKRAKNGPEWQKILSVSLCISWTVHHMIVILVHMCKTIIFPANFFIFSIFIFGVFTPRKRAKNDLKLPTSVCFALYLINCRSHHRDFDNDIYRCFSLCYFFKNSTL